MDKCEHLGEVVRAEIPALRIAYAHRRMLMAREQGHNISYEEAVQNFNRRYMNPFAEGWKLCYCYNICPDRDNCDIKENEEMYLKELERYEK